MNNKKNNKIKNDNNNNSNKAKNISTKKNEVNVSKEQVKSTKNKTKAVTKNEKNPAKKDTGKSLSNKPVECSFNKGNNSTNRNSDNPLFNNNEKKSIKINTADIYGSNSINPKRNPASNNINFASNKNITQGKNNKNNNKVNTGKEVSTGEAIDKMISIGKSLFINGTIIIGISTVAIGGTVFFTGYDPIPIIEKNFIYKKGATALEENVITKLKGLDITKDLPTEDMFNKYYDFVNVDLGEIILDNTLFDLGSSAFNAQMSKFYAQSYIDTLSTNDVIYTALSNIYGSQNRYPYSVSLTSIGKTIRNSESVVKLSIDINAVDDDLGFHVWNIALFINNEGKIVDAKLLAENKTLKNTRTPLNPSLSIITNGIKDSTTRSVNTFLKGMTNEKLYNKTVASGKSFDNSQMKAFFSKLNLEEKDYKVLGEMFEVSKGNGSNFAITEVISTDFDGEPITNIILSLKSDDYTYRYDLEYNRRDKMLIGVDKL